MKALHVGDVVGEAGCTFLQKQLPNIKRKLGINLTIVNGENAAPGNGITADIMQSLFRAGADVITTGNHCFRQRESLYIYENPYLLRPANFPDGAPGSGICIIDFGAWRAAVVNLSGTAFLDPLDNPFTVVDNLIAQIETPNIFVDFHAESTAEKKAMGFHLAANVTAVIGTHTHVQTADETILSAHTAYLTDVGMTGVEESILGVEIAPALERFRFHTPARFCEAKGTVICGAVSITFDEKCGCAQNIERLVFRHEP